MKTSAASTSLTEVLQYCLPAKSILILAPPRSAVGSSIPSLGINDIIIRGGANIAPAEVEGVISRHVAVQNAAVIGVPDRMLGEVPVAFVVRRHGAEISAEELVRFCKAKLAEFKVPREFLFLADFPLGITGKIDKKALKVKWAELHA